MTEPWEWGRLIAAVATVAGALAIGFALRLPLGRLARRAERTRWAWDDLIFRLLRDLVLVGATSLGVWAAILTLRLRPGIQHPAAQAVVAAIILVTSVAAARFAAGVVSTITQTRSGVAQSATIFVNIVRVAVIGVGGLVLMQSLGISVTPLLTALGVGGLAVALALQDTLANLFAGVHILASKKVQPGDYVRLDDGYDGYIVDINWRNTTIQQLPGNHVVVPNSRFADAIMTNYHRPEQDMSVSVQVGVAYDSDLDQVEKVTVDVGREVMAEVAGGVADHTPVIRFHTFGESSVDFTVLLRTREYAGQYLIVHEFIKRLHRRYRMENIEIPFPMRTVVMSDGDRQALQQVTG